MLRLAISCALLLALAAPQVARAEDGEVVARKHFAAGQAEFELGNFPAALQHFRAVYERAPFPALLFDIARCHEELGQWREALDVYRRFLVVAPPDQREATRASIASLEQRTAAMPPVAPPVAPPRDAAPQAAPPLAAPALVVAPSAAPTRPRSRTGLIVGASVGGVVLVGLALGLGLGLGLRDQTTHLPALDFLR